MQMEIPIQAKGFEGRRLAVQTAGMFSSPKLLIDGTPAKQEKGRYVLRDNAGNQVQAKLVSPMGFYDARRNGSME